MFDHVTIRVSDLEASRAFYDVFLGTPELRSDELDEWGDFGFAPGAVPTRHLHIGFVAASREEVDERWRAAVDAGYRSDGEPGLRPQYSPTYYGAFVLDPDGNSIEAVHLGGKRKDEAMIDHLWIGVRDLEAARRFWQTVAPPLGLRFTAELADRFHLAVGDRSFGLVADGRPPTANLHAAFAVPSDEAVEAFHGAAVAAGYRDNGAPGERPQYHAGYVGAFVLDPDGNNIEAVNHHRDDRTAA